MDAVGRLVRDGTPVGTAFVVSAAGLAVTAAHVLGEHRSGRWTFEPLGARGRSFAVDADADIDVAGDVALVRVDGVEEWEPMALVSHGGVLPGAPVHLRGFASSFDHDSGVGVYVGETGVGGRTWVKVSCRHAQPGMSGAPVLLTGTGGVIGLVSSRLNAGKWNRDTVLVAASSEIVTLAPSHLRLDEPVHRYRGGTLRLSWDHDGAIEPFLETDEFHVSFGRNDTNRVRLDDGRDSRLHGTLTLIGASLNYHHLGAHPAQVLTATRRVTVHRGCSETVRHNDRLRFASGTVLVEFSAPDLYDARSGPTDTGDGDLDGD